MFFKSQYERLMDGGKVEKHMTMSMESIFTLASDPEKIFERYAKRMVKSIGGGDTNVKKVGVLISECEIIYSFECDRTIPVEGKVVITRNMDTLEDLQVAKIKLWRSEKDVNEAYRKWIYDNNNWERTMDIINKNLEIMEENIHG